jgi:hypothetical protein
MQMAQVGGLATLLCGLLAFPALTRIDRRRAAEDRIS